MLFSFKKQMAELETHTLLEIPEVRILLEDLSPTVRSEVCTKLAELGISQARDIKYLNPEKDLTDVLRPIQATKMASVISDMFSTQGNISSQPVLSESPHSPATSVSSQSSLSSDCTSPSQNWIASFRIPYSKFPPELIEACEKGDRPKTSLRLEMVRILCSEINRYTCLLGKNNIEVIAAKLVSKYPKSFTDMIGAEVLGSGHSGLVTQIMDRLVNAYGRGHGRQGSKRPPEDNELALDMTSRKRIVTDSNGCINFSPTNLPAHESEESLKVMQNYLKVEALRPKAERDDNRLKLCMSKTYVLQRRLINQNPAPTVKDVQEQWPLLFQYECLMQHFEELTGIDLKRKLRESLKDKSGRRLNFVAVKRNKAKGVKEWLDKIQLCGGITEKSAYLVIPLLAACFGEDSRLIIKTFEETTNTSDLESLSDEVTPYVAVVGGIFSETAKVFLVVENRVVAENIQSLEDGLAMAFASYYVLNLQYAQGLPATLEFIQRCFVDLNPSRGSKSRAKKTGVANNKVMGFLRGYEEFDWNIEREHW